MRKVGEQKKVMVTFNKFRMAITWSVLFAYLLLTPIPQQLILKLPQGRGQKKLFLSIFIIQYIKFGEN